MPIPENPQSRSEQYLNAIATGDNSGLPEFPQSRMEQYLEVIAQNGGGSSGGGVLVVNIIPSDVDESATMDRTWQEIHDAPFAVFKFAYEENGLEETIFYYADSIAGSGKGYHVAISQLASDATPQAYIANSPDGYPQSSD
jgi:hypothetical protein